MASFWEQPLGDLGRSVNTASGNFFSNTIKSLQNIGTAPVYAIRDIAAGNPDDARRSVVKGIGGVSYIATAPMTILANTSKGKELLTDKGFNHYTFGLGDDLYGTSHGIQDAVNSGTVSNDDWNSFLRYGSKSAAIVAGAYGASALYGEYQTAAAVGGSALEFGAPSATTVISGLGAAGLVTQGKYAEAVNSYAPGLIPTDRTDDFNRMINPPVTDPNDPAEFDTWRNGAIPGTSYMGGGSTPQIAAGVSGFMVLAVLGTVFFMLRKKR